MQGIKYILGFDYESYYDKEYSLSKMPTHQYVRDPRFKCLGCGFEFPNEAPFYAKDAAEVERVLQRIDAIGWEKVALVAHNCLPGDVEVLTPCGWQRLEDSPEVTDLMVWEPETGALRWGRGRKVQARSETLLSWDTNFHKCAYTPEHRMYFTTPERSDWRAAPAQEVAVRSPNNTYIPLAGEYDSGDPVHSMSADLAALMEAVRADGSWVTRNGAGFYGVRFGFRKQREVDRLLTLAHRLGISPTVAGGKDRMRVNLPRCPQVDRIRALLGAGKRYEWRQILELPLGARKAILQEAKHWDGSDRGTGASYCWSCVDPTTVEAFQLLAHVSGWSLSGEWRDNSRGGSLRPLFVATVRERARAKLVERAAEVSHGGAVYCYTVPTGAFLIRSKGRVLITGNCAFDGTVLYERFGGRKPGFWLDTQLMARYLVAQGVLAPDQTVSLGKLAPLVGMTKGDTWAAVHGTEAERADYGLDDIRIMMALLRKFLSHNIPPDELCYMDMKVRAGTEPALHIDVPILEEASKITEQDKMLHKLLRKDANMVTLLERCGVEVEHKKMAPTKTRPEGYTKPALAKTDTFMQELQECGNEFVEELASRRLEANSSITRTRAQTMLNVGAPLPMPYLYYGAHTGRDSGKDNMNVQNFPNKGPLRQAIVAPPGYKLVVGDSSQIEARYVGWRAGDLRLLEVFRQADKDTSGKRDAYRLFGGQYMYRKAPEDLTDDERQIAKAGVLGLGFGQGWRGLIVGSRRKGLVIPEPVAKLAVDAYRGGFDRVPAWWRRLMRWALSDGFIDMPDGRRIIYPDIGEEVLDEETGKLETVFYRPTIFSKGPRGSRQRNKLWHGLVCLALDTLVLTPDGWVSLGEVGLRPVWDGKEWVTHGGLTPVQHKTTIHKHGVRLTPNHRVLTDAGWKLAAESQEYSRPNVWLADGRRVRGQRRSAESLVVPMPVRGYAGLQNAILGQRGRTSLWGARMRACLPVGVQYGEVRNARDESAPGVFRMAGYDGEVLPAYTSGMEKLRGAWRHSLQAMASAREFLGRYGAGLSQRIVSRPKRQRPRILPAELPLGYSPPASEQQTIKPMGRYAGGAHDGIPSQCSERHRDDDTAVPVGGRVGCQGSIQEAVADLANCGPRRRFVVCAPGGLPFYAHNCENDTQGGARSVVFWQALQMRRAGLRIVGMSHDETIGLAREGEAEEAAEEMLRWLRTPPPWAEGLPLNGKVQIGDCYKDCK